jgi:hypothetical protein
MYIFMRLWQSLAPHKLLIFIRLLLESRELKTKRLMVLNHFSSADSHTVDPEISEALNYLKHHKYSAFPYEWTHKYDNMLPEVFRDKQNNRLYILFDGKRMYFPAKYTRKHVTWAARSILKEQDPKSPHLYLTNDFQIDEGSIVIDAGVAEGNFALMAVEKAKRLYLIECNPEWMDALKLTFEPWKHKVIFVEKYLSDSPDQTTTSIDVLVQPGAAEKYFIKMDIEGFEQKALGGMKNLVASGCPIKMDICTYHHPNDLYEIRNILDDYSFKSKVSDGYVLYFMPREVPSFRKVLIRAEKS